MLYRTLDIQYPSNRIIEENKEDNMKEKHKRNIEKHF